jgi:predicted MFS family arabinose efflux permease
MAYSLGSIIGPSLGGVIIQGLGWRWIFLINLPIGLPAAVAAARLLPDTPARATGRLDLTGLLRLSIGVPLLVFALAQAEVGGSLTRAGTLAPLTGGVALLLDFVRHAGRRKDPLLDLRLFRRRMFATGALCLLWISFAWSSVLILLPLYFQQIRHATPALAGLLLAPQGVGTAISTLASGAVKDSHRGARIAAVGVVAVAGTTTLLAHLGAGCPYWVICLILLAAGVAGGQAWVPATGASYVDLSADEISHASPLLSSMMRLGQAFGAAFGAIVLEAELNAHRAAGPAARLAHAYHASFQWAAVGALIALVMFLALSRTISIRAGWGPGRGELRVDAKSFPASAGRPGQSAVASASSGL